MPEKIFIATHQKREILDLTSLIQEKVTQAKCLEGFCYLFLLHTTAALSIADLDPGTDLDILEALDKMIPKISFRHPHNPAHTPDHILSTIIGQSLLLPISSGKLVLGDWQRIILLEFDGPRQREIFLKINQD